MALIAAIAMLLQAAGGMSPAMAGQTIEICTAHGTKTISVDKAGAPTAPTNAPCPHCDQCMSLGLAVTVAAPVLVQPVRYAHRAELLRTAAMRLPPARAPPKPPSQGPPSILTI